MATVTILDQCSALKSHSILNCLIKVRERIEIPLLLRLKAYERESAELYDGLGVGRQSTNTG